MNYLYGVLNHAARSSTPKKTIDLDDDDDPIYRFHNPSNPKATIIFFHDVLWGGEDKKLHKLSWMSSSDPPVCWPATWLSAKYPEAQILSTCYDSGIWKKKTTGHMDLYKLGENLRHDILRIYTMDCPVFLVGHGLGGLVIKALIKEMQDKRDALARPESTSKESRNGKDLCRLQSFLKNVKGILYYATPFLGSELANTLRDSPCKGSLLDPLEVLSTEACRLNVWFAAWRRDQECAARCISAGCPTEVALWYGKLVEEASARYDIDEFHTVSKSNHFDVCKPRDITDIRFTWLIELIESTMSTTTHEPIPLIEDNARSASAESVKTILSQLPKLGPGEGLQLNAADLTKIREFQDLWSNLMDGLKEAGFEKTCGDANCEHWEPKCYHGDRWDV